MLLKKDLVRFIEEDDDEVLAVAVEEDDDVDSESELAPFSVVEEEVVELFAEDKDEIDGIERCDKLLLDCGMLDPEEEEDAAI